MPTAEEADRFDEHMNDADALMWNVEKDPLLRSTIVTVLVFDRSPNWAGLVARVERGVQLIPRLRQHVVSPMLRVGPPYWSAEAHFDLGYHLRRVRASSPSFDDVLDIARTAAMAGFDRARPLWEYTLVEGLDDGRSAMVVKIHHSMTDGVGGVKLLMMLMDFARDAPDPEPAVADGELHSFGPVELVSRSLAHRRRRTVGIARRAGSDVLHAAEAVIHDPADSVRTAARTVGSVARFLAPATAPMSPLFTPRSLARRLATLDIALSGLKRAARTQGASLNDAFLAAVVGGLGLYHELHGEAVDELRMVMPINLRAAGDALGGNHFTPARLLVPLGIKDPAERMTELGRRARAIRDEPAIRLTDALAGFLNQLPTTITTALFGTMLKGADFVTSNVPGAPIPLYCAGAELERLYAFSPLSGAALNVTLMSHCETCTIGINADAVAIPDLGSLVRCLEQGFADVLALT